MIENIDDLKTRRLISCFFVLVIAGYFLFLNLSMPLVGEDYTLQPWSYDNSPPSIAGKIDAVYHRVDRSFTTWNPRVGEALAIVTAAFPKLVFNIINTILFTWLIAIIFALIYGRFPDLQKYSNLLTLFIIVFLIIVFFPLFGQVFIWKAGASNHFWGLVLILSFILPFRLNYAKHINLNSPRKLILYTFFGLFSGMTLENVSSVVIIGLLAHYLLSIKKNTLDRKFIYPILANAIGVSVLLFSPATTYRRSYYSSLNYEGDLSGLNLIISRIFRLGWDFISTSWQLLGLSLILITIYFLMVQSKKITGDQGNEQNQNTFNALLMLLILSCISVLVLLTVPYQSDQRRGFAFFWLIIISLNAYLITEILMALPINRRIISMGLLGLIFVVQLISIGAEYKYFYHFYSERMEYITISGTRGEKEIRLQMFPFPDSRALETRESLSDFGNRMAEYYGFDKIEIVP